MKKLFLFLLLIGIIIPVNAQSFLDFSSGQQVNNLSTNPVKTITAIENGKNVRIEFPGAKLVSDKDFPQTFQLVIPGCAKETTSGQPAVLYYKETFDFSHGSEVLITGFTAEYETLSLPLAPADILILGNQTNLPPKEDIVNKNTVYPEANNTLHFDGVYFDRDIYTMTVNTVKYVNPTTIKVLKNVEFNILETGITAPSQAVVANAPTEAINLLRTYSTGIGGIDTISAPPIENGFISEYNSDYIIITHPDLEPGIEDFVEWKRQTGHNVKVFSKDGWSCDEIKTTITDFCADIFSQSYLYLLIIGDVNHVPTYSKEKDESFYATDRPFACINGDDDLISDLLYARIPTITLNETQQVLQKLINYEKNPLMNQEFYNKITHVAYFQDQHLDNIEDRFFVEGSEEMFAFETYKNKTSERIYYCDSYVNPLFWNDGSPIPDYLRKPNFLWNGNATQIINSINNGCLFTLYRGHGEIDEWWKLNFYSSSVSSLNNDSKLPFIFSITCLTGAFDSPDCLSSKLMLKTNGGAIGVIGASDVSYSVLNDAMAEAMVYSLLTTSYFDDISVFKYTPKKIHYRDYPHKLYSMGQIMKTGKESVNRHFMGFSLLNYQDEIYHLFGDPGMMLYTEVPDTLSSTDVEITKTLNHVNVTIPHKAYISFYNTQTKTVQRYYADSHQFTCTNPNDIIVCVKNRNLKPYIKDLNLFGGGILGGEVIPVIPSITNMTPNPASFEVTIICNRALAIGDLTIRISSMTGEVKKTVTLSSQDNQVTINISDISNGIYVVNLISGGNVCDAKQLVIQN